MKLREIQSGRWMQPIVLLSLVLILSGCVGGGVVYGKAHECIRPELFINQELKCNQNELAQLTKWDVESLWGVPDKINTGINTGDGVEYWSYKIDQGYIGIVPMIGIGIPLILPLRSNKHVLKFEQEKLIEVKTIRTGWSGYACGLISERPDWGCTSLK